MTTTETTTAELWAVHVQGPDDVLPMRTREAADKHAAELNESWATYCAANPDTTGFRPDVHTEVVPWDGTAELHAALVEQYENEPHEP